MQVNNIIELCQIAFGYFFLFSLVPFWVRGFRLSGENVLDNLVSSFIIGHIVIINSVFLLSLIGIYYGFTLILLFILIAVVYRFGFKREVTISGILNFEKHFINLKDGYYHPKQFTRYILGIIKRFFISILKKIHNPINLIIVLIAFGFAAYTRCYHAVNNMYLGTSDMYLHLEWIKYLDINVPFKGGIYPFGLHCVVSAMGKVYGLDTFTIMRMIGSVAGLTIVFSLYYVLKKTFKSNLAVNAVLIFYCVLNVFNPLAVERQLIALPQEYGMIFLPFTGYYLHMYMKDKNLSALVLFSASFSMTAISHFYVTIYAVLFSAAMFVTHLTYMNKQVFKRLIAGVLGAFFLLVAPMGIAYAKGVPLQSSLNWALSKFMPSKPDKEEPSGQPSGGDSQSAEEEVDKLSKLKNPIKALEEEGFFSTEINNLATMEYPWFVIYMISTGMALVFPIFKWKDRGRQWDVMGYALYSVFALGLRLMPSFGLPAIMEYNRMLAFFIFAVPMALATPIELVYNICHSFNKAAVWIYALICAVFAGGFTYYIVEGSHYGILTRVVQMQYNGAVFAYYKITENYDDKTWTIISTTDEYSLCLNKGWHTELSEFMIDMHDYEENDEITIPTKYVFIYIDKRPQSYSISVNLKNPPRVYDKIDPNDVTAPFDEIIEGNKANVLYAYKHLDANKILQAKAYAWAQEYLKYFPSEMNVFYEDDEIVVYKIEQNPHALNNLLIPYGGN